MSAVNSTHEFNPKLVEERKVLDFATSIDPGLAEQVAYEIQELSHLLSDKPCITVREEINIHGHGDSKCFTFHREQSGARRNVGRKVLGVSYIISQQCIVCGDFTSWWQGGFRLLCTDYMCRDCLFRSFEVAMGPDGRFPPKCGSTEITVDSLAGCSARPLDGELIKRYKEKKAETKAIMPAYCGTCNAFLAPHPVFNTIYIECSKCNTKSCTYCMKALHPNQECEPDKDREAFVRMANRKGWKECYRCSTWIERVDGCDHMDCYNCHAEFCYICGAVWKTCRCDRFPPNQQQRGDWENAGLPNRHRGGHLLGNGLHPVQFHNDFFVNGRRQEVLPEEGGGDGDAENNNNGRLVHGPNARFNEGRRLRDGPQANVNFNPGQIGEPLRHHLQIRINRHQAARPNFAEVRQLGEAPLPAPPNPPQQIWPNAAPMAEEPHRPHNFRPRQHHDPRLVGFVDPREIQRANDAQVAAQMARDTWFDFLME